MKTNKGSVILILSVVVVLAVLGGGFIYYQNSSKTSNDSMNTDTPSTSGIGDVFKSITQTTGNMSPKEIFLARNTEMYNAQSFEAMLSVSRKYDAPSKIQEDAGQFQNATTEQKQKNFLFSKGFMNPTEKLINISEVINGTNATVTAFDGKGGKIVATYESHNGEWKLESVKTMLTGTNQ